MMLLYLASCLACSGLPMVPILLLIVIVFPVVVVVVVVVRGGNNPPLTSTIGSLGVLTLALRNVFGGL